MSNEVAEERKVKPVLVLTLDSLGLAAMSDLLSKATPKGRVELRLHSKLFKIVNSCREFTDKTTFNWTPSTITYSNEEEIEYFIQILNERVEAGVPGQVSEVYEYIFDCVDAYKALCR